ncbi:hypothetical protein FRB98_008580 [Tulasnella sp. 332]|nr:hypothetical protein FRB98_008580 [Tulasnella sp. 332]
MFLVGSKRIPDFKIYISQKDGYMNFLQLIRQPTYAAPKLELKDPEYHEARCASTASLGLYEQQPSPFDRLATEIIVLIFLLGVQSSVDSRNPLRAHRSSFRRSARLVCLRWNTIVQSHAKLEVWSIVKIEPWTKSQWRSIMVASATSLHLDTRFHRCIRLTVDNQFLGMLFDYFIPELEKALGHSGVAKELEELEVRYTQSDMPISPLVLSPFIKIRRLYLPNVVNLSLSLLSGCPLLFVPTTGDDSQGCSVTLANLNIFRLVAPESTLVTVPSVLQARLSHKLQKSWFQDFDEPESVPYIGEELEWLKDNAGFEEAAPETFSFENLADGLS